MGKDNVRSIVRDYGRYLAALVAFAIALVALEAVDGAVLHHALDRYGIRPRTTEGLLGIALAPFLHGNMAHVITNAVSLVILGSLVIFRGPLVFWVTTFVTVLCAGLGTWIVGLPGSIHIGASGLVFGYLGHLLLAGWFERRFATIALSLVCLGAFGGMIFGVLPGQTGISWESHLFGFLGGAASARLMAARSRRRAKLKA